MLTLNWLSIVYIIGIVQALFLAFSLRAKPKDPHPANKYLIALLLILAFSLFLRLSYTNNNYLFTHFPHLMMSSDFVLFVMGPLLYFYLKSKLGQKLVWPKKVGSHFIPLLFYLLSTLYFLKFSPPELLQYQASGGIYPYYVLVLGTGICHLGFYVIRSLQLLRQQTEPNLPIQKKRYLRVILWSLLLLTLLWGLGHIYSIIPGEINMIIADACYQLSFLLLSMLIFVIGYYAIRLPDLFNKPVVVSKNKYRHSNLDPNTARATKQKLLQLLDQERVYLDTELSLKKLALQLEINQVHLSQVINQEFGRNFYDLINQYRVASFIEMAKEEDYKNLTLMAIALESGFKSKSSFHKAFKKEMNTTPGQYLKQA